jgi:Transposase protein
MQTAAILPSVSVNADSNVRYFAKDGCVDYTNTPVAVYVGGHLIGTFTDEQLVERDLLIVVVCREPRVRMNHVAEAFGISTQTVRRIRRKHERGGVQAIAKSHRRGRPRQQTQQLEGRLFVLFDAGMSIDAAHEELGARVSRSVVARAHKKWVSLRAAPTVDEHDSAASEPLPGVVVAVPEQQGVAQSPIHAVDVEEDEASTDATGELELEQACAEGGLRVEHLGAWVMLAMLNALGLYALAERLRAKTEREKQTDGTRFIGKVTLRVALDAVAIALSIGKRCVEGVRWLATPSGPTLLRREQVISASWARRVLARFGSEAGIELHWSQATSLAGSATEGDNRAVFYIDNHMRPYTGKHTIRKGWRMQDKRARPGVSDYYVHDEEGRPIARIDDPSNGTLTDWLHPMARVLREALGGATKVLMAFDRAGAFAEHMASLRDDHLEFVTYERAPYPMLSDSAFKQKRWLKIGRKRVRLVEAARKNLGKGRGRVRRIYVQTENGAQLSVLAVADAPAKLLVTVLLRRWPRQENQFKHENERWGINQLDGRRVNDYPADEIIPNPARRRLDRELRIARSAEGEALRRLAQLDDNDPKKAIYDDDIEHARDLQRELQALRPTVPTHAPVGETELAGELVRHPGRYKLVIDTLRVALANVESDLAAWLGPELPRAAEAKKTLAKLFDAPGNVRPNGRTITITLEPAGTRAELRAVDSLLSRLNALDLQLPGDPSGRALRFKLDNK